MQKLNVNDGLINFFVFEAVFRKDFDAESMEEYRTYTPKLQEFVKKDAGWFQPKPGHPLIFFYGILGHKLERIGVSNEHDMKVRL